MEGWTDARVEMVTKLWGDGLSASQIAGEIGGGLSRNAVIGKVNRLGLSKRDAKPRKFSLRKPQSRAERIVAKARLQNAPRKRAPRVEHLIMRAERADPGLPEQLTAPTINDAEIPMEQRRTLLELNPSTCRWPVGTPGEAGFYFCGGKAVKGKPYCPSHDRLAYVTPSERRRQPSAPQLLGPVR